MDGGSPANIDVLTYTYGDAARPDRLTNMADATNNAKGFKPTTGAAAYQYDANGNMTQDNHKQFTFAYNYLNLPATMTKGANVITMTYTADGEKLAKAVTGGVAKNYISGIEYSGANLEAIYFSEGRCTPDGSTAFFYEYTIKDHLGNARVNFRAGAGASLTALENMHYYPFGMLMEGLGTNSPANDYAYNGKELNEDFGLNLNDYGARWYDAALGRWWSVDPLGEKYAGWSGYNYGVDNPVRFVDPDGRSVDDYVYLNTKGEEIGRIKDNSVHYVTIIADENLQAFDNLPYGRESIFAASLMGVTYDLTPMLDFFEDNRNDYYPNDQASLITVDGKAPKNIPVERAIPLYLKNGKVTIGNNEPVSKGGERIVGNLPVHIDEDIIQSAKNDNQTGFLHTEPINEKNSLYLVGSPQTRYSTKQYSPNPSDFDAAYYRPKDNYFSVIVRPQEVAFFKSKTNYFTIPKFRL